MDFSQINIKEQRATTDSSVKLLNDFQEKAIKNILYSFNFNDNVLNAQGIVIRRNLASWDCEFHCKFTINDNEFIFKDNLDLNKIQLEYKEWMENEFRTYAIKKMYEKVSDVIAYELCKVSLVNIESFFDNAL